MNKKLIVILLSIFIILVSVNLGVKYYESLTDNVNISITPADNNITQGHNLTVYVNATASVPFRSFLIDATTYTLGAEIQYLGPNGTTPQNLYGLIKFNVTGNEKIITSWNGTVLQNSRHRYPCYTLAPAGYYKIDNIDASFPSNDNLINPIVTYNNPGIHLKSSPYANFTSSNGHFSIKLEGVQYLLKNGNGGTRILITTEYGKLFIVFAFGGKIEQYKS